MSVIKIGNEEQLDPEQILQIDKQTSCIICTSEYSPCVFCNDEFIFISNTKSIDPASLKFSGSDFIWDFIPSLKFSVPKGIIIKFSEAPSEKRLSSHILPSFRRTQTYQQNRIYNQILLSIFFPRHLIENKSRIKMGEYKMKLDFDYTAFAEDQIEQFYIIENNYIFTDFEKHFFGDIEKTEEENHE